MFLKDIMTKNQKNKKLEKMPIWAKPWNLAIFQMNFLNYFFISMHREYQSEKLPIIDSQKSPKTSRKLQKMRQLQASKVDQMFCNTR